MKNLDNETLEIHERLFLLESLLNAETIDKNCGQYANSVANFIYGKLVPFIDELDYSYEMVDNIRGAMDYWGNLLNKPWIENKTVITFMGKFSSGKSSIINSLIKDSEFLPTDVREATAIPTYLSHGREEVVKFADNNGSIKSLSLDSFRKFRKDTIQGLDFRSLVKHLVVEKSNAFLSNISILDTPGYDAIDSKDRDNAIEVVAESDCVFWILDIQNGDIHEDAVEFIKENLSGKKIYVVINKIDLKPPWEHEDVINKISETLRKAEIKYEKCLLYSSIENEYQEQMLNEISKVDRITHIDFPKLIIEFIESIKDDIISKVIEIRNSKSSIESEARASMQKISNAIEKQNDKFEELIDAQNSLIKAWNSEIRENLVGQTVIDNSSWVAKKINNQTEACNKAIKGYFKFIDKLDSIAEIGGQYQSIESLSNQLDYFEQQQSVVFELEKEFKHLIKQNNGQYN